MASDDNESGHDGVTDLDGLINASALEDLDALYGAGPGESGPSGARQTGAADPADPGAGRMNHPVAVLFAWLLCMAVASVFWLDPLPKQHDLGVRSVETRVAVAMYHVAHRVETYRRYVGQLPDYLYPEWNESNLVEYRMSGGHYELVSRVGPYEYHFREGDDPEVLIHRGVLRLQDGG